MNNSKFVFIATTRIRFIKISPIKVNRILKQLRFKTYKQALLCLEFMPYKAAKYIWQILYNSILSLKQKYKLKKTTLLIPKLMVNKGPIRTKIRFLARGRYAKIKHKTAHISLTIGIV